MRSILVLLLGTAVLAGCARRPTDMAWKEAVEHQPLTFTVAADSADRAWERAERWLRDHLSDAEITVSGDRIEARSTSLDLPHSTFTITRQQYGDEARFEVHHTWTARTPFDIAMQSFTHESGELARYIATGQTFNDFSRTYVADSAAIATVARESEERPNRIWAGFGTGQREWGIEAGIRHDWYGFSYGAAESNRPYRPMPSVENGEAPVADTTIERFGGLFTGVNGYGYLDLTPWCSLYASVGAYVHVYERLSHSNSTGSYYQLEDGTVWEAGTITFGAGVQTSLARRIVIGLGYSTAVGWMGHLGYRF